MKFVAASKLRRAQEAVFAARPYARQMQDVLASAMARIESPQHPLLARRPEERVVVLLVTGDKGLCGTFNANVIRRAVEFGREHQQESFEVVAAGKKGCDALRKRKSKLIGEYINLSAQVEFSKAKEIGGRLMEMYAAGQVDAVYAIYNEFKSVLAQRVVVEKLLPIGAAQFSAAEKAGAEAMVLVDYIYEQPPHAILNTLLPRHVETQVFRVLLESAASEHAARMTAMDAATTNAAELIDQVTLYMNKVRQAAITREIIEVVSGAASTA